MQSSASEMNKYFGNQFQVLEQENGYLCNKSVECFIFPDQVVRLIRRKQEPERKSGKKCLLMWAGSHISMGWSEKVIQDATTDRNDGDATYIVYQHFIRKSEGFSLKRNSLTLLNHWIIR